MPQEAYPVVSDLTTLFQSTSIVDSSCSGFSQINLAAKVAKAVADIEKRTGRTFLAVAGTRTYDPPFHPQGILSLGRDLCSDSLAPITVTVMGSSQVIGTDVYFGPDNADNDGQPWETLELPRFRVFSTTPRKCIVVTGSWGYSLQVPDDIWEAALEQAALLCVPELALNISSGLYKIDDVAYAGGTLTPLSAEAAKWELTVRQTVDDNKRVISWIG